MDRFFKRFWDDDMGWSQKGSFPAVNIAEDENQFTVELAAPGLDKKDLKVTVDHNVLTIEASKEQKTEEKNDNYRRVEFNYSNFKRSFTLPDEVNADKIASKYENGVIHIDLPKRDEAKPRPIREVKVG
jgi:HSP20 family protein